MDGRKVQAVKDRVYEAADRAVVRRSQISFVPEGVSYRAASHGVWMSVSEFTRLTGLLDALEGENY